MDIERIDPIKRESDVRHPNESVYFSLFLVA
jgi:hypothetical protein